MKQKATLCIGCLLDRTEISCDSREDCKRKKKIQESTIISTLGQICCHVEVDTPDVWTCIVKWRVYIFIQLLLAADCLFLSKKIRWEGADSLKRRPLDPWPCFDLRKNARLEPGHPLPESVLGLLDLFL